MKTTLSVSLPSPIPARHLPLSLISAVVPIQEEYSSPELSPDSEAAHQPAASALGQPIIAQPNNLDGVVTEQPTELTNLSEAAQTATYGLDS